MNLFQLLICIAILPSFCFGAVVIDGELFEPQWENVQSHSGWVTLPNDDELARYSTELKAFADSEALYLAILCEHPGIQNLPSVRTKRDAPVWMGESVEIFLQPDLSIKEYAHIAIDTQSSIFDEWSSRGPKSWTHEGLQAKCKKNLKEGYYVIEMKIPFDKFGAKPKNGEKWGFNVIRTLKLGSKKAGEISTWSNLQIGAHEPENFGIIEFKNDGIVLTRKIPRIAPSSPRLAIQNWSFENGLDKWKEAMYIGGKNYADAQFEVGTSSTGAPVGERFLRIIGEKVKLPLIEYARGGVSSSLIKLDAGEYELKGYYRTNIQEDGRIDKGYVSALILTSRGKPLAEKFLKPTEQWRRFSIPFVVFKKSYCSVMLRLWSNGEVGFDAIEVIGAESKDDNYAKEQTLSKSTVKLYGKKFELLTPKPQQAKLPDNRKLAVYNRWPIDSIDPTSAPQANELIENIHLSGCRGERESTPLAIYGVCDLKNIKILLKPAKVNAIPAKWMELNNVIFWKQRTAYTGNEIRVVPELIRPVKSNTVGNITGKQTRLLWITFNIPVNAVAGEYFSTLFITSENNQPVTIPVKLVVHSFVLPDPAVVFGLWLDLNTPPGRRIYPFMKSYGVKSATFPFEFKVSIKNGEVMLDSSKGIEALKGYRDAGMLGPVPLELSSLSTRLAKELGLDKKISHDGTHDSSSLICPASCDDYPQKLQKAYRQAISQIRDDVEKAGLSDMVMLYPVDEPTSNPHRMPKMMVESRIIREAWPDVKIFATTHDPSRTRQLKGLLDVPCVSLSYLTRSKKLNAQFNHMAEECDMQLWAYGGTMMEKYWPVRALGFRAAFGGAQRMLGWVAHYANANPNDINDDMRHRLKHAATFYPEEKTFVSTIQWEALREAVDDTRYLAKAQMVIKELKKSNPPLAMKFEQELRLFKDAILSGSLKCNKDCDLVRNQLIEIINSATEMQKK